MVTFIRIQRMHARSHSWGDDTVGYLPEHEIHCGGLHDQGLYSAPEDFIRLSLGFPSTALLCHSGQTDSLSAYTSIALGIFQRENDPQQLQVLLNYFWCFSDMNQCFNGNLNRDRQTHSAQGKERLGVRSHR